MSVYIDNRLAGPDTSIHVPHETMAIVQDASIPALDDIPHLSMQKKSSRKSSARASRAPLRDRTADLNISASRHSPKARKPVKSVRDDVSTQPFSSFHPLPSIPSASLTFPSFRDAPVQHTPAIADQTASKVLWPLMQSTPPPSPPPASSAYLGDVSSDGHQNPTTEDAHENTCQTLAFKHPNSPYVPWETPVKRQLLRPLTRSNFSLISGLYSRPLSRSGAKAPEPGDISDLDGFGHTIVGMSNRWKTLRRNVNSNVRRVAKSFDHIKRPFIVAKSRLQFTCVTPINLVQTATPEDVASLERSLPQPAISSPRVRSPSTTSVESSGSRGLNAWLAFRSRLSSTKDYEPGSMLSMGETDMNVSRMNRLSTAGLINPACGVPGCSLLHSPDGDKTASLENDPNLNKSWFTRRFDTPSRHLLSQSSFSNSSTPLKMIALHSRKTASADDLSRSGMPTPNQRSSLSPRRREMSMPGGWTFG